MARARTGSRATAEDVLQDVWLQLEGARLDETIENPGGFIHRITANTIAGHLRKERRRSDIDAEVNAILWESTDAASPERAVIARDHLRAIEQALQELPPRTREIFLMNRMDGISHRKIAERLGISDEAVYYHIRRALERLAALRAD